MLETKTNGNYNIRYALDWASNELELAGITCARKEAEMLLANILNLEFAQLYLKIDNILKPQELEYLKDLTKKRCLKAPLQYLMQKTCFYGLELYVDKGVFIPRPETEVLVEKIIELIKSKLRNPVNILELCTGSGNISVALTKNLQYCTITSSDISSQAIDIARENAKKHDQHRKIEFIQGDLFAALSENSSFDIIIANPPYICSHELKGLPQDVTQEPQNALDGGQDGLVFYKRIIAECKPYLKSGGYIVFEFGDKQKQSIERIISNSQLFEKPYFFADLNGIVRFVIARRSCG